MYNQTLVCVIILLSLSQNQAQMEVFHQRMSKICVLSVINGHIHYVFILLTNHKVYCSHVGTQFCPKTLCIKDEELCTGCIGYDWRTNSRLTLFSALQISLYKHCVFWKMKTPHIFKELALYSALETSRDRLQNVYEGFADRMRIYWSYSEV